MRKQSKRILVPLLPVMLAAGGLVAWSFQPASRAQQETQRQLQRNGSTTAANDKRIALVIGNGSYTSAPPLKNPPNDARDMGATLQTLGFEVTSGINLGQREMKRLIREFGQNLKAGGSGLFYFAGHGVQSKGRNYLIPIDADIQSEAEVEDSGVDLSLVLNLMDEAQNGLNLVILDACRSNPFARSFRSATDGLAQVDAPTGTLIAYATAPGRVATDAARQNGLYTSELLKAMQAPGLSAVEVFMRVRAEVMKQTDNKQVPWEASSLVGSFYFSAGSQNSSRPNAPQESTGVVLRNKVDPAAFELSYWETIKNSSDPADFQSYLEKYPAGEFAVIARRRLKSGSSVSTAPPRLSEPEVDQAVAVLVTLGAATLDLGRFGEETESVAIIGRCQLKYENRTLWNSKARFKPSIGETIISLADVNTASIATSELTPPDRPRAWVVTARTITGRPFTVSVTGFENRLLTKVKVPTKTERPTAAFVGAFMDSESANRYAKAFANAARLCGARSETF